MREGAEDIAKASAASFSLIFAGWLSVGIRPISPIFAQVFGGDTVPLTPNHESIFEFAVRQGGAFAILLIVLFYYRRDYRDLVAFRTERDQILVDLVKESTKANTEMANALRENNVVVHQAKNVMATYLPTQTRRIGDQ